MFRDFPIEGVDVHTEIPLEHCVPPPGMFGWESEEVKREFGIWWKGSDLGFPFGEEVAGVKLGQLLIRYWAQEPVVFRYFPHRFEFMRAMELTSCDAEELVLNYDPHTPYYRRPSVPDEMIQPW
eukprot:GHVU01113750.1.p4 GENE.GHVU01113750.1~~GHVU01113750.1.p4  ORF type:complete len:124 (-),score=22.04 GHVU01113750.1:461-832(-)